MEPKNYKKTLHLPQTLFPMKADLPSKEPLYVHRWKEQNLYDQIQEHRKDAPLFILHDGPPYANGRIHHGHIFNKTLKDIVVKYHVMSGFRSPYIPGWDCHGLPIEQKIDEELGLTKKNFSQFEIRQKCREYAQKYVDLQREDFERIGVIGDFKNPYITMSYDYESRTLELLGRFFEQNLVYKGFKPVHWSWAAQTALADAEVEYKEYTAPSVYVSFPMMKVPDFIKQFSDERPVSVLIWTTTPWTLPANLAIALNPDFDYVLVDHQDQSLIIARGLLEQVSEVVGVDLAVRASFVGSQLVGTSPDDCPRHSAKHPFLDRESVLLPASYVTLDQGTGCVHTAPGHGEDDFHLGTQFGLPVLVPVDARGCYDHHYPDMQGKHVFEANSLIIDLLVQNNRLLSSPSLKVVIPRYPYCWRTKKPVIFRATEQWFISIDKDRLDHLSIRQNSLKIIHQDVTWIPSWGEQRIYNMMEHRPDWCISRQRLWGVPITIFTCVHCKNDIVDSQIAYHVSALMKSRGSDVWFEASNEALVPENYVCPHCHAPPEEFIKSKDILDVWFDSGASWFAALQERLSMSLNDQVDLYLEGSDQHRGWFNSSLIASVGVRDCSPYKSCLTHGFILDEHGNKYSKSSKNYESPEKMLSRDGADILRLWTSAVDYRGDIALSPQIMETVKDSYRKIRNTFRFLLANLEGFDFQLHAVSEDQMGPLDQWILSKVHGLVEQVDEHYKKYEFHSIYHLVVKFMTLELSNQYLNFIKDRIYAEFVHSHERRSAQTCLYFVLHSMVRLLAPILSFTMEEVWDYLEQRDVQSVHLALFIHKDPKFSESFQTWKRPELEKGIEILSFYKDEVYKKINDLRPKQKGDKLEGQIGSSEEAEVYLAVANQEDHEILVKYQSVLAEYWVVSKVHLFYDSSFSLSVKPSQSPKCDRCWRYQENFIHEQGSFLCSRCFHVLESMKEL
jgi:isoleucyl-tRNA synthetase